MTWFADLAPCSYFDFTGEVVPASERLRAVGWLAARDRRREGGDAATVAHLRTVPDFGSRAGAERTRDVSWIFGFVRALTIGCALGTVGCANNEPAPEPAPAETPAPPPPPAPAPVAPAPAESPSGRGSTVNGGG